MRLLENGRSILKAAGITVLAMALLAGCGAKKEQEPSVSGSTAAVVDEKTVTASEENNLDGYPKKSGSVHCRTWSRRRD